MNIDDAILKIRRNEDVLQKPAHDDVLHSSRSTLVKDRIAELFVAYSLFLFDHERSKASRLCKLQALRSRIAGDHQADFHRQRAVLSPLDQIAQRRATAGDENCDGKMISRKGH